MKRKRQHAQAGWATWCCPCLILLSGTLAAPNASAQTKVPDAAAAQINASANNPALALLDADAGLVLGLRISQLEKLGELLLISAPEARGSISLATLGVSAFLGWSPLRSSAWGKSGFAVNERLYLQVESLERKAQRDKEDSTLWRTRLLLPASDAKLAKSKLEAIRFRKRVLLGGKEARQLGTLLQMKVPAAKKLKERLQRAGVFMVAKPAAVPGILLVSQIGRLFIVDHLRLEGRSLSANQWAKNKSRLLAAMAPSTNPLAANQEASAVLQSASIGIWLNPETVAETLLKSETSVKQGEGEATRPCTALRKLTRTGYFSALSLRGEVDAKAIHLDLRWQLRNATDFVSLLTTEQAPVLAHDSQALHAVLRLSRIGDLRKLKRAAMAQTWDGLWKSAQRCHDMAGVFAMAIDWPHIAGLFLEELSALHPEASRLIDNLGSMAIHSAGQGESQELVGEAWIRQPGVSIAASWLRTLFGHQKGDALSVQWGRGSMRPYALTYPTGSVVGSDLFGPVVGHPELGKLQSAARGTSGASLFALRARPSALRLGMIKHPFAAALATWRRLSADLTIDNGHLRFTIDLQKD